MIEVLPARFSLEVQSARFLRGVICLTLMKRFSAKKIRLPNRNRKEKLSNRNQKISERRKLNPAGLSLATLGLSLAGLSLAGLSLARF